MAKDKKPVGRPTKMTDLTVKKLEEAFLLGCTDEEACFYAEISRQTLQNYQEKNPDFIDRKEQLKQNPFLLARRSIVSGISENPETALKYMERKKKDEFGTKQSIEHSGNLTIEKILSEIDGTTSGLPED